MKCVRCGKENSTYVCDECRKKEEEALKNQQSDDLGAIAGIIILITIIVFIFKGCAGVVSNNSNKISQEKYNQIDSWLMYYYENYYNVPNWYVTNTSLKWDEYVVIHLVAAEDDYVNTLKTNQQAAINFAQTVCPGNNEKIYNLIDRSHLDVDVYDKYGNFVTASSCDIGN